MERIKWEEQPDLSDQAKIEQLVRDLENALRELAWWRHHCDELMLMLTKEDA